MRKRAWNLLALLALLLAALPAAYPLAAGSPDPAAFNGPAAPQQSGDAGRGADFLISVAHDEQDYPAIAYNATDDHYLVVWNDRGVGTTNTGLYGQRYTAAGGPLGDPILIYGNEEADIQRASAAAYNSTDGEYLVVWHEGDDAVFQIMGQRIAADGTVVAMPFVIDMNLAQNRVFPDVVYDPNANHYLVAWHNSTNGDVEGLLLNNMGSGLTEDAFSIAPDGMSAKTAFNSNRNSYMVVYMETATLDWNIAAQAIAGDGSLTGPAMVVCDNPESQSGPSIAFNGTNMQYLVAWSDTRNFASTLLDVYGRRLDEDGNPLGGEIVISNADEEQATPNVVYNPSANQYLVVWDDYRNDDVSDADLYGQRVQANGSLADQGNFAISTAPGIQWYATADYSTVSHQYLVAWTDERNWSSEVYGQRLHWLGLPLGYEFIVDAAPEEHEEPAVAYNRIAHQYLVVWADDRDGDGESDIWGQLLSSIGHPLGENFVIRQEAGDETRPAVAYDWAVNNYLVVWDDVTEGDVEGIFLTAQGTPLGNAFNIATGGYPAVVYAPTTSYLVVFSQNHAGTGDDIYGRFLEHAVAPPPGDGFPICDHAGDQRYPAVAYNAVENRYLVVWTDARDDDGDIIGRGVQPSQQVGAEIFYGVAADAQTYPAVAWNSIDDEYLVTWHDYRDSGTSGADIYGRIALSTTMVPAPAFAIADAAGDQQYPYVNYVSTNNEYYVGWQDNRNGDTGWDIYGMWVAAAGAPGSLTLPLFRYSGWQQRPAGAYDPDNNQGLAVWQDGRNGDSFKVHGRLGVLDQEPPVANFTRYPSVGEAGSTFLFDARRSTDNATPPGALIVRWDWNSDGAWDTLPSLEKVVTRTVALPGLYTVTLGVWDMMLLSDTVAYPILVITPTANTPPVAALTIIPTAGPPGTAFALDATASTDAEDPGALQARWDINDDGSWETGWGVLTLTVDWVYAAGDYTARAEVRDPEGLTDAAIYNYRVAPGPITDLEVNPPMPMLRPGEAVQFHTTAEDEYANLIGNPEVTWTLLDPGIGTLDANGVFTAGSQIGTFTDVIQAESTNGITATATVIIYPAASTIYVPVVFKSYSGPVVETELAHDDGTMDSTDSYDVGGGFATCFTPPGGSATIQRARLYVQLPSMPVEMHVWDAATHADLLPSPYQGNPWQDGWNDIDLSSFGLTVTGDFCVGFLYLTGYQPTLGVDTSAPIDGQSYEIDGAYWELQTYDAMIRVVVTQP